MDERTSSMSRRRYIAALSAVGTTAVAGCLSSTSQIDEQASFEYDLSTDHNIEGWPRYDPEWTAPTTSPFAQSYTTETVVKNLEIPWDISFAPDGTLFLTERTGTLNRVTDGRIDRISSPDDIIDAGSIPPGSTVSQWFLKGGAGGMHGVAVHPEYPDVPIVYTYYTYLDENEGTKYNKVVAYDVTDDRPEQGVPILDRVPSKKIHNGGRIAFGPRNFLWVTTGDAGEAPRAQSLTYLGGKVLRLTPTGEPAPGNPNLAQDADPRIFTYGHRNPQGLTWLQDGTPIVTEHGPNAHDEVNVLAPGSNYGWPRARTKDKYESFDFHRPVVNTGNVTWAPSGSLFYTGTAVPGLRNRLLIATLRGQHLNVVTLSRPDEELPPLDGGRRFEGWYDSDFVATSHRLFEDQLGRLRGIAQHPDGGLYLVTSNRDGRARNGFPTLQDDRLLRIVPSDE